MADKSPEKTISGAVKTRVEMHTEMIAVLYTFALFGSVTEKLNRAVSIPYVNTIFRKEI